MKPLLPWKSSKYYIFLCVFACGCCMYVGACMRVALLIEHAEHMCHIVTSSAAPLAPPCFSKLSHKWHNFEEKVLNIECVFLFSIQVLFKTFLILRIIQQLFVINVKESSCKVPIILVRFERNLNFVYRFLKKSLNIKIHPVGTKLFHMDGQMDMIKPKVALRNFASVHNIRSVCH
jgi:hypothetical protein